MLFNNFDHKVFAIASFVGAANAYFRMPCDGRLLLERADPIVSPGQVSGHVHTISGGSGFGFSMDYNQTQDAQCTSCAVSHDKSNYWTPKLYWMSQDRDAFEDVPQINNGGMTVYYQQRVTAPESAKNKTLGGFPEGFRMIAGNPFQRNDTGLAEAPGRAVSYVCLDYNGPPHKQTGALPDIYCPDGLRAQIYFPSCWNGVDLDTEDHKSHMAYPEGEHFDSGTCPESHPFPLISIFFEIIYDTSAFVDRWHTVGGVKKQPFVFAQGDTTGYGFHGDFVMGWNKTTLDAAVRECTAEAGGALETCPVFVRDKLIQDSGNQTDCLVPPSVDGEAITGNLTKLPGCNTPSGKGPAATPEACPNDTAYIGQPQVFFADVTKTLDYEYLGCASDDMGTRTFQGPNTSSDNMTISYCVEYCKDKGYSFAGLEWSSECYCGNEYSDPSRAPRPGIMGDCEQPCAGDASKNCGGSLELSVYKNCNGGSCKNVAYGIVGNGSTTDSADSEKRKRHLGQHRHARLHRES